MLRIHFPLQAPKSQAIGRSAGPAGGNESTRSATCATAACVASARGSSTATTISSATLSEESEDRRQALRATPTAHAADRQPPRLRHSHSQPPRFTCRLRSLTTRLHPPPAASYGTFGRQCEAIFHCEQGLRGSRPTPRDGPAGFERIEQSGRRESNSRPLGPKPSALPGCATSRADSVGTNDGGATAAWSPRCRRVASSGDRARAATGRALPHTAGHGSDTR